MRSYSEGVSFDGRSSGRAWWATVPSVFRVALWAWVVSLALFLIFTAAEVAAVNMSAAVFGVLTGGVGAMLLANIGGAATMMSNRPGTASRWALEVRRTRGPSFYRMLGAVYVAIGVVMFIVGALGKIHISRY